MYTQTLYSVCLLKTVKKTAIALRLLGGARGDGPAFATSHCIRNEFRNWSRTLLDPVFFRSSSSSLSQNWRENVNRTLFQRTDVNLWPVV